MDEFLQKVECSGNAYIVTDKNMRPIKYRVWNGYELIYNAPISLISTAGINEFFETKEVNEFTGLKDRNGVEIYEGDIVSGKRYGFGDRKWIITWSTDLEYCGFVPREVGKNSLSAFISWGNFEVIGNIYQNQELVLGNAE